MTSGALFNLARGVKGVALLLFLVPWVTVSCGTERVSMSGLDLVTGAVDARDTLARGNDGDLWVIAAACLILAGLASTFVLPRARAALLAAAAAGGAALLIGYTVLVRLPAELGEHRPAGGGDVADLGTNAQQTADLIRVEPQAGFWLVMAALIAATALNLMARGRAGP